MKRIVAAVDFSDLTPAVIDTAVDLATSMGGELVLFHAAPSTEPWVMAGMDGRAAVGMPHSPDWERHQALDRHKRLEGLREALAEDGIEARTHMTDAVQRRSICGALEELSPGYIVIGSHGHNPLYDLLGPGVCSRIVRRAKCPVVVVHPHDRPRAVRDSAPPIEVTVDA